MNETSKYKVSSDDDFREWRALIIETLKQNSSGIEKLDDRLDDIDKRLAIIEDREADKKEAREKIEAKIANSTTIVNELKIKFGIWIFAASIISVAVVNVIVKKLIP